MSVFFLFPLISLCCVCNFLSRLRRLQHASLFPWINHSHAPQGCGWFLTCRTIQTRLPVSKRLNCDLISRCEYPSRNPSSPLDCRAGDRFAASLHLLHLLLLLIALLALYVTFAALSARFSTQADVRGTATQVRTAGEERAKHGGRADERRRRRRRVPERRASLCWRPADCMVDFFILRIWIGC